MRGSDAIGRVYTVHPNNGECYYLRMLLHSVHGPTCFADLRTVDGDVCDTYGEACQRRGLLEGDEHWHKALTEAALNCFPRQLRDLFSIIVTTCAPSDPQSLWETQKESLSEDVLNKVQKLNPQLNVTMRIF